MDKLNKLIELDDYPVPVKTEKLTDKLYCLATILCTTFPQNGLENPIIDDEIDRGLIVKKMMELINKI